MLYERSKERIGMKSGGVTINNNVNCEHREGKVNRGKERELQRTTEE